MMKPRYFHCRIALILNLLIGATARSSAARPTTAPSAVLAAGELQCVVYAVDQVLGHYRGTRFDWSGMVGEARLGNKIFWNEWNASPDAEADHDNAVGPALEFDMDSPIGFTTAQPGEGFIKIGVGVLQRPDDRKYFFRNRYKILDFGERKTESSPEGKSITHTQVIAMAPYGYRYEKRLTVSKPATLTITCRLVNTGTKPFSTDVYAHNFFRLGDQGWAKGTTVHFDRPVKLDAAARGSALPELRDGSLEFTKPLEKGSVFAPLAFGEAGPPRQFSIKFGDLELVQSLDFDVHRLVLYGLPSATCIEPFLKLSLDPGQSREWTYRISFRK